MDEQENAPQAHRLLILFVDNDGLCELRQAAAFQMSWSDRIVVVARS